MGKIGFLLETQSISIIAGLVVALVLVALLRKYVLRQSLDLFAMWGDTRMVVYVAVSGALYFAVLVPFKFAVLVPGLSEIRPGVALPFLLSFLFGPAAAWGAGIGNFIGDFFGMFGPGSLLGFFGNFLLGYIPYVLYRTWVGHVPPSQAGLKAGVVIGISVVVASFACAVFIAWGAHLIGLAPFAVLAPVILTNNVLVGVALALPLTLLLYRRAEKWGVVYYEVMDAEAVRPARTAKIGAVLLVAGAVGGWLIGMGLSIIDEKPQAAMQTVETQVAGAAENAAATPAPAAKKPVKVITMPVAKIAPGVAGEPVAETPEQAEAAPAAPVEETSPWRIGLGVAPAILLLLIGILLL